MGLQGAQIAFRLRGCIREAIRRVDLGGGRGRRRSVLGWPVAFHRVPSARRRSADIPIADCLGRDAQSARARRVEHVVVLCGQRRSIARPPAAMSAEQRRWRDHERTPLRPRYKRLAAARSSQSTDVIGGRVVRRRKMPSSCRRATISNSLKSRDRLRRMTSWRTRRSRT
jgi:hypothetical protein